MQTGHHSREHAHEFMRQRARQAKEEIVLDEEKTKGNLHAHVRYYAAKVAQAKKEVEKVVRGQEELVLSVLRGFICHGNVLLEGLPGLGKTVLCRCMAKICQLDFKRIQFTTDLLPSDVIGIVTYDKDRGFEVMKGPVFCNLMLADEVNRAPPKVQSALLEAMGERQVTLGHETHELEHPFLVVATQNPIEQSGTFPLPEAQVDRFMFKVVIEYPNFDSEFIIMDQNLTSKKMDAFNLKPILSKKDILLMQALNNYIHVETKLKHYILNIVRATRDPGQYKIKHAGMIEMGASPRATICILLAANAQALIKGRHYVVPKDIKDVVYEVLRHRIYLNFKAKMENVSADMVIKELIDTIKIY